MSSPVLVAASGSKIMIDGNDIPGVQSIEFKISRNRQNIHSLSTDERIGAYFGPLVVQGSLKIKSTFLDLDKKLFEKISAVAPFQIVVELQSQGSDKLIKKISFDEVILEEKSFGMDATGVAITIYNFTATRVREE
jgi:hypothetical protein